MPLLKTFIAVGVLTALGYLGNVASMPVAFSVSFLFGSIFVIIAVSLFGPLFGGLSALIASSYTYILWNHPYAIVIFVCEALWVSFFLKRKQTNIVLIDAAYWLLLGLPLVFIFYFGVMSLGFQSTAIVFLKQSINGIINALIAGILISHLPWQKLFHLPAGTQKVPYSQVIFQLTSAFLMLPLVGMLLFTTYQDSKTFQTVAGEMLVSESKEADGLIHSWLKRHIDAVEAIAKLGKAQNFQPSGKLQDALEQINSLFPDIHAVFIADNTATSVAFIPAINEKGEKTIGMNFADRESFKQLKNTLKPVISDVFQGRGGVFAPIFTISVPIVEKGKLSGFGLGALNLSKMRNLLVQSTHLDKLVFTVVDQHNNIVCSTNPENSSLRPWKKITEGQTLLVGKGFSLWTPSSKKNISVMDVWKDAIYFVTLPIADTKWTLVTEMSVAPLQGYLYQATIVNLALIFCFFIVAIILSQIVSKLLVRTPVKLAALSRDIPEKIEKSAELTWPDSNIADMHILIENFKETTQALTLQYQNIKDANIHLEERVQERTAELLESEEKHKRMIANISDVIAIMDKGGTIRYKSPNIEKWFGWQPEDLIGADGWETVHPEDLERIQKEFFTILERDNSVRTVEYRYKCKDGSYKLIELTAVNLANDPLIHGVLMNYRDITERRQAEADKEKLEAQNRQLQKAESLRRMAGAIAHTFNNQLGVVIGNLDMAVDQPPGAEQAIHFLAEAMEAANKAAEVSGQMLTYLGQSFDKRKRMDLADACRRNLPILEASVPGTVALEADCSSPGPSVMGNASEIQQVLTNLITNAWEAVGTGRGSIHLSVKTVFPADIPTAHRFPVGWQPQNNAYACLEVADTGDGIAFNDIEKLFDPFFSSKFMGRGLGLAMVLGIVQAHDGAVTVESTPGRGSAFRIFFPVSAAECDYEETFPHGVPLITPIISSPEPGNDETATAGSGTILLVEDDGILRNMATAMLTHLGFTVLTAKDGLEAVEVFKERRDEILLVLSDLTMPCMDGWETLTALRKLAPGIPVILASGYDKAQVMAGDHPELPQVFLSKPYKLKELGDAIDQALVKMGNEAC